MADSPFNFMAASPIAHISGFDPTSGHEPAANGPFSGALDKIYTGMGGPISSGFDFSQPSNSGNNNSSAPFNPPADPMAFWNQVSGKLFDSVKPLGGVQQPPNQGQAEGTNNDIVAIINQLLGGKAFAIDQLLGGKLFGSAGIWGGGGAPGMFGRSG